MGQGWKLFKTEKITDTKFDRMWHQSKTMLAESESELESYSNPELYSEWGDKPSPAGYWFALRYAYGGDLTYRDGKLVSRDFCQNMVALSDQGVEYRFEDIDNMSEDGVNGDFAAAGSNRYNIFDWKGGIHCHHWWARRIYVYAPDGEATDVLPEDYLDIIESEWDEVMKRVGNNPYVPQPGLEGIAPIDLE